jgi:pimeloyl-ACP methyl ester carboxylesterase
MSGLHATLEGCQGAAEGSSCPVVSVASSLEAWQREAVTGTFDAGHYRCPYFRWGEGPALVFIPGLCSDGLTFVSVMALLREHFHCIGYDLPADGPPYGHDDLVADLLALLDHLEIRRCNLLGFSFGSTIALGALSRQPQRFARAVLQGGFARRPLAPAEVFACSWGRYLPGTMGRLPIWPRLTRRLHAGPFASRAEADWRYFVEAQGRTPVRAFSQRALIMHQLDLRARLAGIACPVLLVSGERDPLVARCYQEELRAALPCASSAEIEGCGHHAHLSHPEVLAEALEHFLMAREAV